MLKKTSFELLSVMLLAILSAMVFSTAFHAVPAEAQTSAVTGEIVNPLTETNDFAFNSSVYPVNSTFTVDFNVTNVNDMAAWQIDISWNNSIINFTTVWIPGINSSVPGSNVFTQAINAGATPLPAGPEVEYDSENNGYLLYGAVDISATDHLYPVNVVGSGLLCSINFTVQVSVTGANILRGAIINFDSSNTDPTSGEYSYVVNPSDVETQISANNATLEIYGSEALIPEFTPWMIMPFFIVATLLAVLLYRRKNRWPK